MLNRSAILLRPLSPFLQWLSLDDMEGLAKTVIEDMRADPHIYLVPEFEDQASRDAVVKSCWAELFEEALEGWLVDDSGWPPNRTLKMFLEWFEIETFTTVEDMGFGEVSLV